MERCPEHAGVTAKIDQVLGECQDISSQIRALSTSILGAPDGTHTGVAETVRLLGSRVDAVESQQRNVVRAAWGVIMLFISAAVAKISGRL